MSELDLETLSRTVTASIPPASGAWWEEALALCRSAARDRSRLLGCYAAAGRKTKSCDESGFSTAFAVLAEAGASTRWISVQCVRACMLLEVARTDPRGARALVEEIAVRGDNEERAALLKTLGALPDAGAYLEAAVDACRTNVQDVFESIACENPYPSRYFDEGAFNQMVLKAVFLGIELRRVSGLAVRRNGELTRMARDYAAERRAAGRPVPEDLASLAGENPQ